MYEKFRKAFKISVPLVSVNTADPALFVTMAAACLPEETTVYTDEKYKTGALCWDTVRGLYIPVGALEDLAASKTSLQAIEGKSGSKGSDLVHPHVVLQYADYMRPGCVMFMHNLNRFFGQSEVLQGLSNLRDIFKMDRRMIVMAATANTIPPMLRHDVLELDEPLPTLEEVEAHLRTVLDGDEREEIVQAAKACQGFSLFGAEQVLLLNTNVDRVIDVEGVWADKCAKINQVPGLKVASGRPYSSIAGVSQIKKFVGQLMTGNRKPNVVVWVDEFEKALGGASTDTSGVTQDQVAQLLYWMESTKAGGCILAGDPGTAKSAFAQATGCEFGVPTIRLDLGAMKGSLVGDSEGRIREALSVLGAVSAGKTLWLATVNSIDRIPPELRRRFRYGTWYFGLPDRTEREAIWSMYCGKWDLDASEAVDLFSREWTGAEIETCCDLANQTGQSLMDCAEFIAPISQDPKGRAAMEALQAVADGAFLSASRPGVYTRAATHRPPSGGKPGSRSVRL